MMATRFAWMAHRLVSSKRPTRYASLASCSASTHSTGSAADNDEMAGHPAVIPADTFELRTSQFFDLVIGNNVGQLRELMNQLNADELNTLLGMAHQLQAPVEDVALSVTALAITALVGQTQMSSLLLERGADPNLMSRVFIDNAATNITPLQMAAHFGQLELSRELITFGANVDLGTDTGRTPLMAASARGHLNIVTLLVDNGANIELSGADGHNPLLEATLSGKANIVRFLLVKRARIEHTDSTGTISIGSPTPLMIACRKGFLDIVTLLTDFGAHIDLVDPNHYTALMYASEERRTSVVQHLLSLGASTDTMNQQGRTALDLASGHPVIVAMLSEAAQQAQEQESRDNNLFGNSHPRETHFDEEG